MDNLLRKMDLNFFGKGKHKITPDKLLDCEDALLLDVRSSEEFSAIGVNMGHLDNIECINIPVNQLPDRINEVPKNKFIAIFCPANVRATMAYMYLLSNDYENIRILDGGYPALTDAVKPGKVLKYLTD
jgi:rhodanese-related sulfurtransferase